MIAEELWPDILKRLPLKTLIRLRCVCKSWNSLLSSSFFATHHLHFTAAAACSAESRTYFQVKHYSYHRSPDGPICGLHHQQDNTFTPLDHPRVRPQHNIICLGVVHGVVCLYYFLKDSFPFITPSKLIALWNPSIRKYVTIPLFYQHNYFTGFGFDGTKNDFKVVVSPFGDYYEVFSVRDGMWRRKALPAWFDSLSIKQFSHYFVNGTIYWLTGPRNCNTPYVLLLFDCGNEEFRTMELPTHFWHHQLVPLVFIRGGLLTVLKFVSPFICELWTMQEEGDMSTWSKLHQIDHTAGDIIISGCLRFMPLLNEQAQFQKMDKGDEYAYVFEESLLLMDIGKHYDQDEVDASMQEVSRTTNST